MQSRTERKIVTAALLLLGTGLLGVRLYNPIEGSTAAILLTAGLTAGVLAAVVAGRRLDPHQIDLTQKKSYMLTLRSVLITTLITGVMTLLLLFAAGIVISAMAMFGGYRSISASVLADALQRLIVVMQLPSEQLAGLAAAAVLGTGTGFWLLHPYLPIENEEISGPVTFVIAWLYVLAGAALVAGTGFPDPVALALDTAIVGVWGHFFAVAYEDVQAYVP